MRFVCPYCESTLNIPERFLGQRGMCNKCGGRIALIGVADRAEPQRASKIGEAPAPDPAKPATEKQLDFLRDLGARADALEGLDREDASAAIDAMKTARRNSEPATEKQVAYLARLGATKAQIARAQSKEAASQLIEAMHVHPTPEQLALLRELGAPGAKVAALKSSGAAAALIEELRG